MTNEDQPPQELDTSKTGVSEVELGTVRRTHPDGDEPDDSARNLDLLLDVPLHVTARLGSTEISIRELLKLGPGAVVALDRQAGESVDLLINGLVVGQGDVVVVNDSFGLRITRVVSQKERLGTL
jgi:flagellar motor switch protein FliN/FliY